jgi:glucoamylase
MSRSLVLGNGNILVCEDDRGQLRDFYFHYVGLENQMYKNCIARVGVWVDGAFSWLTSPEWVIAIDYKYETLAGVIVAVNHQMGIELQFGDCVYNEKNIFLRHVTVKNQQSSERTIKVFFSHQFNLSANKAGNTGFYDPVDNTIVHYKGRRIVIIGSQHDTHGFDDYTIGVFGIEGKEGTWLDAEDGLLSKNPIEHGPVDSTIGFYKKCDANSQFSFYYWLGIDKTLKDAKALNAYIKEKTPAHLEETTTNYWSAWVNKHAWEFDGLERRVTDLFKKSLLVMRTHVDNNGAIIASGDSDMLKFGKDTYSYVWPRDASFISMAFDKAGYYEVSHRFFVFANEVISEEGFFYHKYQPDKSLGSSWHPWILGGERSLPIQEDETALVIFALWQHYQLTGDLEFVEQVYNSLIKCGSNFILGFRDVKTKLPFPTYDLWEMKNGVSTFTCASVYGALTAAGNFARLLGKLKDAADYERGAAEVKKAIIEQLWNKEDGFFYKHIVSDGDTLLHDKTIDMSSFYGIFKFGILSPDDPKLTTCMDTINRVLVCKTGVGGIARFEHDAYYHASNDTPGNPWFVTSLWLAQYYIARAKSVSDLQKVHDWINWVVAHAMPSGILSEQIDPHSGEALSASPLIWSHAEFVTTVMEYVEKQKALKQ